MLSFMALPRAAKVTAFYALGHAFRRDPVLENEAVSGAVGSFGFGRFFAGAIFDIAAMNCDAPARKRVTRATL